MDWSRCYDCGEQQPAVRFLDVGCGYGGLLGKIILYFIQYLGNFAHF
jgi:hypothetical protein